MFLLKHTHIHTIKNAHTHTHTHTHPNKHISCPKLFQQLQVNGSIPGPNQVIVNDVNRQE